jgi:hypothetical protein
MPLIDLADHPELYAEIHANARKNDGTDFEKRDDMQFRALANEWAEYKRMAAHYKELEDRARKNLIDSCKGKNCEGFGVKIQKVTRRGNIKYDQIEALQGLDLEQYRDMPSESWRVTVDE